MTQTPEQPAASGTPQVRRRRALAAGILLGGTLLATAAAIYVWQLPSPPGPPPIDLSAADPAAAAVIEQALRELAQTPRSASAWGGLGMVLVAHAYHAEGNLCFVRAEQLDPREPRWPYYHGITLLLSDPEAAIPLLWRAAELDDKAEAPRLRLAETLLAQGQLDEAEKLFRPLLRSELLQPYAWLGICRVAYGQGRLRETLNPLMQAASNPCTQKAARTLLAEVYQRLGDGAAAARELGQAAEAPENPSWPDPWAEMVQQLQQGLHPQLAHADQLLRQGHVADALGLLQQVVLEYPESELAWLRLGLALLRQGDYPAAEEALRRATRLAPGFAEAHFQLGVALFLQKKPDAEACFRRATDLKRDYGLAHYNLGLCLKLRGERAVAIEEYRTAVRCRPYFAAAHAELGDVLYREGRTAEALVHLQHAAALNPADAKTKKLLGELNRSR